MPKTSAGGLEVADISNELATVDEACMYACLETARSTSAEYE